MQAKTSRCATCVVALAAGLVAGFAGAQTVESPVKVTDGPWGKSVGEPQISRMRSYTSDTFIIMWQTQLLPDTGPTAKARHLE
jgi:hypothetical protein